MLIAMWFKIGFVVNKAPNHSIYYIYIVEKEQNKKERGQEGRDKNMLLRGFDMFDKTKL